MKLTVTLIVVLLLFTAPAFSELTSRLGEIGQLEKHTYQLFIFVLVLLAIVAGLIVALQVINEIHRKDMCTQDEKIEAQQKQIEALQQEMEMYRQERIVRP